MTSNIDPYIFDLQNIEEKIEPILVNIETACNLTGIGRNRLLKFTKQKGFPALIFPHKILIDKKQLPVWLKKNYGIYKD